MQYLDERLKDLGIEDGCKGLLNMGDTTTWKWEEIANKLIALQIQDFNNFSKQFFNLELSQLEEQSQLVSAVDSSDLEPKYTWDKITNPQVLAEGLLSNDFAAIDALWMMGYLENQETSHIRFVLAFHELGKMFYERRQDKSGLDPQNHFKNAQIFLDEIRAKLPPSQQFKIDDLIADIDSDRFKFPIAFAALKDQKIKVGREVLEFMRNSQGNTVVAGAIQYGSIEQIQMMFSAQDVRITNLVRAPILYSPNEWDLAIHYAAQYSQKAVIELLLSNGFDVDALNYLGQTALMIACRKGDLEIFNALPNANSALIDNFGDTVFHWAVSGGNKEIVQKLLDRDAADIDAVNFSAQSALTIACQNGNPEIVRMVLGKMQEVYQGNLGSPAYKDHLSFGLSHALHCGHFYIARILVDAGADVNQFTFDSRFFPQGESVEAINERNFLMLKFLFENNLTLNADLAAEFIRGIFRQDIDRGKFISMVFSELKRQNVDIKRNQELQNLILGYFAVSFEEQEAKNLGVQSDFPIDFNLLNYFSDFDLQNRDGITIAHLAAFYGREDLVEILINYSPADFNMQDIEGNTPLITAILEGNDDVAMMLLLRSDINIMNTRSETALFCAARAGFLDLVRDLLNEGACLYDCLNYSGQYEVEVDDDSPDKSDIENVLDRTFDLFNGVNSGEVGLVRAAIAEGAIIFATDESGQTPLEIAMNSLLPNEEIIEFLKKETNRRAGSDNLHPAAATQFNQPQQQPEH